MSTSGKPLISDEYRQQLQSKHGADDDWGNTGVRHYDYILQLVDAFKIKSVLDYGCGKGTVGAKFRADARNTGIPFYEYDPGIEGKTDPTTKGELLINTDVLEHIEPDLIDNVLADMSARALRVAFMVINCAPAQHLLPDGRNAHLIIENPGWWAKKLKNYFSITQAEKIGDDLLLMALPKKDDQRTPQVKEALATAQGFIDEKNFTRARLALEGINDIDVLYLQAQIAYGIDDHNGAAQFSYNYLQKASDPDAQRILGLSLGKIGRYTEALKCFDTQLCRTIFADDAEYLAMLMLCWNQTFQPEHTVALFGKLTFYNTLLADQYVRALLLQLKHAEARAAAEKFAHEHPSDPTVWAVLCYAYDLNRMFEDALRAAKKCVELDPDNAAYHSNLGLAYLHLYRTEEAGMAFDNAIALDPTLTAAYANRANIYRLQDDYAAEEAQLRTSLEIEPVLADAHYGLGISLIHQEKYAEGLAQAEWFWHKNMLSVMRLPLSFRRWYGEPLQGKVLLIYADQGIGDTLMMARYINVLLEDHNPAALLLNVNPKLRGLFEYQYREAIAADRVAIFTDFADKPIKGVDFSVAATSLPHVMDTRIDTIPKSAGYLRARDTIDYRTPEKPFVIGISWYTKSMDSGIYRSLKLMDFAFLGKIPGVRIVNLQYGDTAAERADAAAQGFEVFHDDAIDVWNDLQAAADQIAACDLIISIDNTTVHTSGALGKPTWVILPKECYWRWPVKGDTTPWYDSMRLFRQKRGEPYTDIMPEIESALAKLLAGDRAQLLPPAKFKPLFPKPAAAKKALVINDTQGCYTWGNYASLQGMKTALVKRGYDLQLSHTLELQYFAPSLPTLAQFDDPAFVSQCRYRDPTLFHYLQHADAILINGEGMLNRVSDAMMQMFYLAYVAKIGYGRKVSLVNFSCFPEGGMQLTDAKGLSYYLKGLKVMDSCHPRELATQEILSSIGISSDLSYDPAVLMLDAYLSSRPAPKRTKNIVITAGPGYDTLMARAYAGLCSDLAASGYTPVILYGAEWQTAQEDLMLADDLRNLGVAGVEYRKCVSFEDFMDSLLSARLFVSGFYSNVVLAHAAGIPVLPFTQGGSAVALSGLAKTQDLPTPVLCNDRQAGKALTRSIKILLDQKDKKKDDVDALRAQLCAMALKNLGSF